MRTVRGWGEIKGGWVIYYLRGKTVIRPLWERRP